MEVGDLVVDIGSCDQLEKAALADRPHWKGSHLRRELARHIRGAPGPPLLTLTQRRLDPFSATWTCSQHSASALRPTCQDSRALSSVFTIKSKISSSCIGDRK